MKKIFSNFLTIFVSLNILFTSFYPFFYPVQVTAYDATRFPCGNTYPQCNASGRVEEVQPICDETGDVVDYDVTDKGECPTQSEPPPPEPQPTEPPPPAQTANNPSWYCSGNFIMQVNPGPGGSEFEYYKCHMGQGCRIINTPGYQSDAECYTLDTPTETPPPPPPETPIPATPPPEEQHAETPAPAPNPTWNDEQGGWIQYSESATTASTQPATVAQEDYKTPNDFVLYNSCAPGKEQCDDNYGKKVCIDEWKNSAGTIEERIGSLKQPEEICSSWKAHNIEKSLLNSCLPEKKCDPEYGKMVCIEEWIETTPESPMGSIYTKTGILTNEFCKQSELSGPHKTLIDACIPGKEICEPNLIASNIGEYVCIEQWHNDEDNTDFEKAGALTGRPCGINAPNSSFSLTTTAIENDKVARQKEADEKANKKANDKANDKGDLSFLQNIPGVAKIEAPIHVTAFAAPVGEDINSARVLGVINWVFGRVSQDVKDEKEIARIQAEQEAYKQEIKDALNTSSEKEQAAKLRKMFGIPENILDEDVIAQTNKSLDAIGAKITGTTDNPKIGATSGPSNLEKVGTFAADLASVGVYPLYREAEDLAKVSEERNIAKKELPTASMIMSTLSWEEKSRLPKMSEDEINKLVSEKTKALQKQLDNPNSPFQTKVNETQLQQQLKDELLKEQNYIRLSNEATSKAENVRQESFAWAAMTLYGGKAAELGFSKIIKPLVMPIAKPIWETAAKPIIDTIGGWLGRKTVQEGTEKAAQTLSKDGVNELTQNLDNVGKSIKVTDNALKKAESVTADPSEKEAIAGFRQELKNTQDDITNLNQEINGAINENGGISNADSVVENVNQVLNKVDDSLNNVKKSFGGTSDEAGVNIQAGINEATVAKGNVVEDLGKQVAKSGDQIVQPEAKGVVEQVVTAAEEVGNGAKSVADDLGKSVNNILGRGEKEVASQAETVAETSVPKLVSQTDPSTGQSGVNIKYREWDTNNKKWYEVDEATYKSNRMNKVSEKISPDKTVDQMLQDYNLTPDSIVYRATPKQYVKDGVIQANPSSVAVIRDPYNLVDNPIYQQGSEEIPAKISSITNASRLKEPTLNVTVSSKGVKNYASKDGDYVVVGIRVGDILEQGGKIYPDVSAMVEHALIFTIPEGEVKVASVQTLAEVASSVTSPEVDQAVADAVSEVTSNIVVGGPVVPKKPIITPWEEFIANTGNLFDDWIHNLQNLVGSGGSVKGIATSLNDEQLLDANAVELFAKKNLIKQKLQESGSIDSNFVKQIMGMEIIKPEVQKTKTGYILTTGKAGIVEADLEEGKYLVNVDSIVGVDIKIPQLIEIKKDKNLVLHLIVDVGSGKVEKPESNPVVPEEKQGNLNLSKLQVAVFSKDQQILPWAGVRVTLEKAIADQTISLNAGWNLITLTAQPTKILTASSLIEEITKQGGYATTVSTLEDGVWKSYVVREGDKTYSANDFTLVPGKAYFIKALRNSNFKFEGRVFADPIKLQLSPGWNAVGIPNSSQTYQASTITDALNAVKISVDMLSRFESGLWDTFIKKSQQDFGNNFPIENNRGYILKLEQGGEFAP